MYMKKRLLILILILCLCGIGFLGFFDYRILSNSNKLKSVPVVYTNHYATILCDTLSHEYTVAVYDKFITNEFPIFRNSGVYDYGGSMSRDFHFISYLTGQLGYEMVIPTYDSALVIKKMWDEYVDEVKIQHYTDSVDRIRIDSIEKRRHKYIICN